MSKKTIIVLIVCVVIVVIFIGVKIATSIIIEKDADDLYKKATEQYNTYMTNQSVKDEENYLDTLLRKIEK